MMTKDEIFQLITALSSNDSCVQEMQQALTEAHEFEAEPAPARAREVLAVFSRRERTTREAGLLTCGFVATLQTLAAYPLSAVVLVWGFKTLDRVFVLFIDDAEHQLIGCIRVTELWYFQSMRPFADIQTYLAASEYILVSDPVDVSIHTIFGTTISIVNSMNAVDELPTIYNDHQSSDVESALRSRHLFLRLYYRFHQ